MPSPMLMESKLGMTVILLHHGNLFQEKVPAGAAVGNGFGKLIGWTQVEELGEMETPLVLTNTLSAPCAAQAPIDWTLVQRGNEKVRSVNPIVGETNDGMPVGKRPAKRGLAGLARTGVSMSNGSGDYVIAFSTSQEVRWTPERCAKVWAYPEVPNNLMSPLFQAAIEATEEAIYNSLCMAETITGCRGVTVKHLPLDKLAELIRNYKLHP